MNEHIDSGCSDLGISQSIKSSKLGSAPTTLATKTKSNALAMLMDKKASGTSANISNPSPSSTVLGKRPPPESRLGSLRSSGTAKVPKIEPSEIANTSPNKTNEGESSNNQHAGPLKQTTKHKPTGFFSTSQTQPLADLLRPSSLDDLIGQESLVGPEGVLRQFVKRRACPSFILWGPSGVGKTTLARIVARECGGGSTPEGAGVRFVELSATIHGTNDCKRIFEEARRDKMLTGRRTFLFLDEVHRFNKSQQDVFLPHVEKGDVILIGATTENPSFKLNAALLSRCRVLVLKKLIPKDIQKMIHRGLRIVNDKLQEEYDTLKDLKDEDPSPKIEQDAVAAIEENTTSKVVLDEAVIEHLSSLADGDGRVALNLLEMVINMSRISSSSSSSSLPDSLPQFKILPLSVVKPQLKRTHLLYDRAGDSHYDTISAFHKSVRGSDPDAALFYLGRMLESGEDPLYLARRMIRIASEDIGLADNTCLPLAVAAHQAVQAVGMPEADVVLAHCAVVLAKAPKSVMVYRAYKRVKAALKGEPIEDIGGVMKHQVEEMRNKKSSTGEDVEDPLEEGYSLTLHNAAAAEVPIHLRNAPTKLMKKLGYGKIYKYNPDYLNGEVRQAYMPEGMVGIKFIDDNHLGDKLDQDLL